MIKVIGSVSAVIMLTVSIIFIDKKIKQKIRELRDL